MGDIFSKTAPLLDTDFKIVIYIICYLLFIGVVLAIGFGLCIYIDHRRQTRLSRAILDEERISSEGKDVKGFSEENDEQDLSEGKYEKTPLLPTTTHQDQNRQFISDLHSCTYVDENLSLLSSNYGATTPLRLLDKRTNWAYTIDKPANFPRLSATQTAAPVPKLFTKCGMRCNEVEWNSRLGQWIAGQGGIESSSRGRRDERFDVVIEPS